MWEKLKEFFKKTWGFFAGVFVGFVSLLFIDRRRGSRADGDIQKLREQLEEYKQLIARAGIDNSELEGQLDIAGARIDELEDRLQSSKGDTNELERVNQDIRREQCTMGEAIGKLGEFIEKHGKGSNNL